MVALIIETLLGFLTFTGSLMALGKLQEVLPQRPITYRSQNLVNLALFAIAAGDRVILVISSRERLAVSRSSPGWRCCSACC